MSIEDKKNNDAFERAAFAKAIGEGIINGKYTNKQARDTAEQCNLPWFLVEYWADIEYNSQRVS